MTGVVDIAHGGTGATTQADAANAILPPQSGHGGKFLMTDGANVSWGMPPGGGGGSITIDKAGHGFDVDSRDKKISRGFW